MLEDLNAIRALTQMYVRHLNAGAHEELARTRERLRQTRRDLDDPALDAFAEYNAGHEEHHVMSIMSIAISG